MGAVKKILLITPSFLVPARGACEQDRLEGILQLQRLGYEVRVIGKVFEFQSKERIENFSRAHNIPIHTVPYRYNQPRKLFESFFYHLKRFVWPLYWDGAVYEYADPVIKQKMKELLEAWKPDIVWFDYTFMLPLYPLARQYGCSIITHSLIYDPKNLLEEEGRTVFNYVRAWAKTITDYICIKRSDYLFAIAPDEKKMYEKLGAKKIAVLSLRALYHLIGKNSKSLDRLPLNVFFLGSSYNIKHNLGAVTLVIEKIIPAAEKKYPGKFKFFITGGKLPEHLRKECLDRGVEYAGFVSDLEVFLSNMDIALIPSLFGTGMQQKIFEPLTRGFPTITSKRGLGEYPFECGKDMLCADTANEFVEQLGKLLESAVRQRMSKAAVAKSALLFSQEVSDSRVQKAIAEVSSQ